MSTTERDPFALAGADAELADAEREFRRLEAEIAALRAADADEAVISPVFDQWMQAMDRIATTVPASIAGCAIKLRMLLHPQVGVETGESEHDVTSLRQILATIERLAGEAQP